jgi:arsenite/tail-anchored protein-transporting ATPase
MKKTAGLSPIILVTGKGGVGKSFTAALLAKKLSLEGRKTLLVDMVPESYLANILRVAPPKGVQPQTTRYGFDWALWLGEDCLAEYIQYWIRVPLVAQTFLKNSWLKSLVHSAPGLREIAFLGKLTSQERKHGPSMSYDHIVVDAVSTGHFLSTMKAPGALAQTVQTGPMREQSLQIQRVLSDAQMTQIFLVSNLERYSLRESEELTTQIHEVLGLRPSSVANRVYPVPPNLESPVESMTAEQKEFLEVQNKIKKYQEEATAEFKKNSQDFFSIPFYFSTLEDVLERDNEIRSLFTKI